MFCFLCLQQIKFSKLYKQNKYMMIREIKFYSNNQLRPPLSWVVNKLQYTDIAGYYAYISIKGQAELIILIY